MMVIRPQAWGTARRHPALRKRSWWRRTVTSGASNSLTLNSLRFRARTGENGLSAWKGNADRLRSPSRSPGCWKKNRIWWSRDQRGANMGDDVIYSVRWRPLPRDGFSVSGDRDIDRPPAASYFDSAARVAVDLVQRACRKTPGGGLDSQRQCRGPRP